MAETLKITQQHNRESDSSRITHMHIDAIHTYSDRPSNNSTLKGLQGVSSQSASPWLHPNPKTAQQNDRESNSSTITHMRIDAIHTYERSTMQQFDSQGLQGVPSLSV